MLKHLKLTFVIMVFVGCAGPAAFEVKPEADYDPALPDYYFVEQYPGNLNIVTRKDWGWELLQAELEPHSISRITLHHGGEDFPAERDVIQYMRNLQSWSRSEKGWIDIPYHYMIDLTGKIYEARPLIYPGDTNTDYDPRGHALICVMGNYENQILSETQLDAVIRLSAYLAQRFDVDPSLIKGHKDYTETLCPGKDFYRYIADGTIRDGVGELFEKN